MGTFDEDYGKYGMVYSMYTPAGNYRVHQMVQKCTRVIQTMRRKIAARRQAVSFIHQEMKKVSAKHEEIWDTECHWAVCDATAEAFKARDWEPYNRFND